ncbi:MAG: DUF2145 domain-containing protein [Pseudobdellovibrionaceae bacterium]
MSALFVSLLSACHSNQPKTTAPEGVAFTEEPAPTPGSQRTPAASSNRCDLKSDRCSGKPLNKVQEAKTAFLTDLVADKLVQLENSEKQMGRDFKVALIARMGSNLEDFQPLKDVDSSGHQLSKDQIIAALTAESNEMVLKTGYPSVTQKLEYKAVRNSFDRSRKLKYSHVGIALKNMPLRNKDGAVVTRSEDGFWTIVHLLYSCENANSSYIFKGTLKNFFYDHMHGYGAQIIIPDQEIQNNIESILVKNYIGKNWMEKHYNAIALPNDLNQQNSNQWVLEVLAAALYEPGAIQNRVQAQEVLKRTNYQTTKVTPTGFYSAIGNSLGSKIISKLMPTMCMDSQPSIRQFGIGEVITALSLEEYLAKNKKLLSQHEVELTKQDQEELDSHLGNKK